MGIDEERLGESVLSVQEVAVNGGSAGIKLFRHVAAKQRIELRPPMTNFAFGRERDSGHIPFQTLKRGWLVADSAISNRCMGTTNLIDMGIVGAWPR